jgi:hypothetical protein
MGSGSGDDIYRSCSTLNICDRRLKIYIDSPHLREVDDEAVVA